MLGLFRDDRVKINMPKIDVSMPIEKATYVVLDTELTGLDFKSDSIVSIGALKMTGTIIHINSSFYTIVKPNAKLSSKSIVVHQITPSETESKQGIEWIIEDFFRFCNGSIIVGHFISLDLKFLSIELKRSGFEKLKFHAVDTSRIYDWIWEFKGDISSGIKRGDSKDLFHIAKKLNIPVKGAHNSLMDAYITAQLFQRFLSTMSRLGVKTVQDLLNIGKP